MIYAGANQQRWPLQLPALSQFIGSEFVAPLTGNFFVNASSVDGSVLVEFPPSGAADIDEAVNSAHFTAIWGKISAQERSRILFKMADRIEKNLTVLAVAETWNTGKAMRETLNIDIPLAADRFR